MTRKVLIALLFLATLSNFREQAGSLISTLKPGIVSIRNSLQAPLFSRVPPSSAPLALQPVGNPSVVNLSGQDYAYEYTVDGDNTLIQGVVYNALYSPLTDEERAVNYDQDFRLMREAGINAILGTGEQFDELTLIKAHENGLGVVMRYTLDPFGDYANPEYREALRQEVSTWIKRFKDFPALRIWALGKEVLQQLGPEEVEIFSDFYVQLADLVHELDPNHPVIYRGVEDIALAPLIARFNRDGIRRPWFGYGVNIFTLRIEEVLQNWPEHGWDVPLIITGFGPLGLYPADRPLGYVRMWQAIQKSQPLALGGFAYVWTTAGPNFVDEAFGLMDKDGNPADGSFQALRAAFRGEDTLAAGGRSFLPHGGAPPPPVLPPSIKAVLGPSKVEFLGSNYEYSYVVNGHRQRIQGMGYNTLYSTLPVEERAARYDRDFRRMKEVGVSTIIGWGEQRQFDELTLIKAQEHRLGVVMPYYLDPFGDYTDPDYRQAVRQDVAAWVKRFKDYPALRIWGLGNEVLHLLSPEQAEIFSELYLQLADLVHELDPNHPVIYRGAEDFAIEPLIARFNQDGASRPWLGYGLNIFTFRIDEVIQDWPTHGWDVPLIITEFGPLGLKSEERPTAYLRMWETIQDSPQMVLGGFAYVWTTAGPEKVDLSFGLVNEQGQPVDKSLDVLAAAFRRRMPAFFPFPT